MSTLKIKYWMKITRPMQCILGGLAAWTVALLSNGPTWFNTQKIAAGEVIFLSILGASVWHYGARADVYAQKHWDPVYVKNPTGLLLIGLASFIASMLIAWKFLPMECLVIAIINFLVILFYAKLLDRYWPWKNLSIAGICATPLLLGWFSGHRLHPIIPPIIIAAFFFYLTREIFKDIVDLEANRGKRLTMVMDIGISAAIKIGGIALTISILIILYSLRFAPHSVFVWAPCILGIVWLLWFAVKSLRGENVAHKFSWMDLGVALIIISFIGIRFCIYY